MFFWLAGHDLFDQKFFAAQDFVFLASTVGASAPMLDQVVHLVALFAQPIAGSDLDLETGVLQHCSIHGGGVTGFNVVGHYRRKLANLQDQRIDLRHVVLTGEGLDRANHIEHDA